MTRLNPYYAFLSQRSDWSRKQDQHQQDYVFYPLESCEALLLDADKQLVVSEHHLSVYKELGPQVYKGKSTYHYTLCGHCNETEVRVHVHFSQHAAVVGVRFEIKDSSGNFVDEEISSTVRGLLIELAQRETHTIMIPVFAAHEQKIQALSTQYHSVEGQLQNFNQQTSQARNKFKHFNKYLVKLNEIQAVIEAMLKASFVDDGWHAKQKIFSEQKAWVKKMRDACQVHVKSHAKKDDAVRLAPAIPSVSRCSGCASAVVTPQRRSL